jgi:hypothetical protein
MLYETHFDDVSEEANYQKESGNCEKFLTCVDKKTERESVIKKKKMKKNIL